MQDLPVYPDRSVGASGGRARQAALAQRLGRLKALRKDQPSAVQTAYERRTIECVYETLRLTGAAYERSDIERSAGNLEGGGGGTPEIRAQFHALREIVDHSRGARAMDLRLIVETHQRSNPELASGFRSAEIDPQFRHARKSPAAQIGERLQNLLGWMHGQSGQEMPVAEKSALFFARFVEVAPFERRNFRTAHLLVNIFPLAAGFPMIALKRDDAEPIRQEIEQAMQFDTAALVARFDEAIDISVGDCERLLGL